jgi:hypothetical protein
MNEWAELEDGARITGFLAILASGTSARSCVGASIGKRPLA